MRNFIQTLRTPKAVQKQHYAGLETVGAYGVGRNKEGSKISALVSAASTARKAKKAK